MLSLYNLNRKWLLLLLFCIVAYSGALAQNPVHFADFNTWTPGSLTGTVNYPVVGGTVALNTVTYYTQNGNPVPYFNLGPCPIAREGTILNTVYAGPLYSATYTGGLNAPTTVTQALTMQAIGNITFLSTFQMEMEYNFAGSTTGAAEPGTIVGLAGTYPDNAIGSPVTQLLIYAYLTNGVLETDYTDWLVLPADVNAFAVRQYVTPWLPPTVNASGVALSPTFNPTYGGNNDQRYVQIQTGNRQYSRIIVRRTTTGTSDGDFWITTLGHQQVVTEICNDGIDNNGNGLTDCLDPACIATAGITAGGPTTFCDGGSVTLTATPAGAAGYTWSTAAITQTIGASASGNYIVTVTNAQGCSATASTVVVVNANPIADAGQDAAICAGNSTTLNATATNGQAAYTFTWDNGLGLGASQTVSPAATTTYTVTVTDANGCSGTDQVIVTVNANPIADAGQNVTLCLGESTTLTATATSGTAPFNFTWDNGAVQGQPVTPLATTTYSVTVTDANGCSGTDQMTVTASPLPTVTVSTTDALCNGACNGSATATLGAGTPPFSVTFLDANGTVLQTGANTTITGLCAGNYTVNVVDGGGAAGCTATASFNIVQPTALQATLAPTAATCGLSNGSIVVTASGGTGNLTYAWSPNVGNTATVTNLAPGLYTVTVTDANGCSISLTQNLNGGPAVTATAASTATTCGGTNGTATVTVNTGSPNYTFVWAPNVSNTDNAANLAAGTYDVTITDAAGCTATVTTTVGSSNGIAITGTSTAVECIGGSDGSITTTVTPGGGTYTYNWTGGGTGANPTGLTAGNYTVTATDAAGCTATVMVNVADGIIVNVDAGFDQNITLGDSAVLIANATPAAGNYVWTGPDGFNALTANTIFVPTAIGDYVFTMTFSVGNCTDADEVTVSVAPEDQIAMPNAFTPNNDGANDTYTPLVTGNVTILEFVIFNRWGKEVFNRVKENTLTWDGFYKGAEQPRDVFMWFVKYTDAEGVERMLNGEMVLIR